MNRILYKELDDEEYEIEKKKIIIKRKQLEKIIKVKYPEIYEYLQLRFGN